MITRTSTASTPRAQRAWLALLLACVLAFLPASLASADARIDAAIEATRNFFEQMGVPTRLSGYGLDGSSIPALLAKLEEHGMTQLGEHGDITLDVSRRIYEAAR